MWSHTAEQVVSRLIAALPAHVLDSTPKQVAQITALPIGVDMWAEYFLCPNGDVLVVGEDFDNPDAVVVKSDRCTLLRTLVWGSERYPELKGLLPARTSDATDCVCLQHPDIFGPGKCLCPECGGLGWLPTSAKV